MTDFNKLSQRQQNILRFIDRYLVENGFPPTIRDIGEATEIASTSVVNYNLNKLVDAGFLERTAATSRGLRLIRAIPGGRHAWIQVVRGTVRLDDETMSEGDGVAISDEASFSIAATSGAELLIFDLA